MGLLEDTSSHLIITIIIAAQQLSPTGINTQHKWLLLLLSMALAGTIPRPVLHRWKWRFAEGLELQSQ